MSLQRYHSEEIPCLAILIRCWEWHHSSTTRAHYHTLVKWHCVSLIILKMEEAAGNDLTLAFHSQQVYNCYGDSRSEAVPLVMFIDL